MVADVANMSLLFARQTRQSQVYSGISEKEIHVEVRIQNKNVEKVQLTGTAPFCHENYRCLIRYGGSN